MEHFVDPLIWRCLGANVLLTATRFPFLQLGSWRFFPVIFFTPSQSRKRERTQQHFFLTVSSVIQRGAPSEHQLRHGDVPDEVWCSTLPRLSSNMMTSHLRTYQPTPSTCCVRQLSVRDSHYFVLALRGSSKLRFQQRHLKDRSRIWCTLCFSIVLNSDIPVSFMWCEGSVFTVLSVNTADQNSSNKTGVRGSKLLERASQLNTLEATNEPPTAQGFLRIDFSHLTCQMKWRCWITRI
mgnify:CR=1 FL=1